MVPPTPKKGGGKHTLLYKYYFEFTNANNDIDNFSIDLSFEKDVKIINASSSETAKSEKHTGNKYSLTFTRFKKSQSIKLHVLISNWNGNDDFIIKSQTPDVVLIKSQTDAKETSVVVTPLPVKHHFLVASALQEEIKPLLKDKKKWEYFDDQKITKTSKLSNSKGNVYNVLLYSINKMGMPINGVAITKIIEQHKPKYLLFIGTCGGLKKTNKLKEGDILVPEYIYSYDSGKHNDKGKFEIEHRQYEVSPSLIGMANDMMSIKNKKYKFNVKPSCGFCSGASVVSSKLMRNRITKKANRKVLGFDMEAYVIAVINHLYPDVETLVIKGIMDFGKNKGDEFKEIAINNAAEFAYDLMEYIIENEKHHHS